MSLLEIIYLLYDQFMKSKNFHIILCVFSVNCLFCKNMCLYFSKKVDILSQLNINLKIHIKYKKL